MPETKAQPDRAAPTTVVPLDYAPAPPRRWLAPWSIAFGVGFLIGFLWSEIYLLLGGSTLVFVPHWAEIAFLPGWFVGWFVYESFHSSEAIAEAAGCLTVGVSYGLATLIAYAAGKRAWRWARASGLCQQFR